MKKLALAIAAVLASGAAFAETATTDLSDLSSTADAPNNLYDFIDDEKVSGSAYSGAELGGNVLLGDQADNFEHGYMFKAGADLSYAASENVAILIGGEARYFWGGTDSKVEGEPQVDRFQFGLETVAGKTTFGKQCGTVDAYAGFGDISKEHGLGAEVDDIACTDQLWNHVYAGNNFEVGASFDPTYDSYGIGGSFTLANFVIGGTVLNVGETNDMVDDIKYSTEMFLYTVGVVGQFDKFTAAVKYVGGEEKGLEGLNYEEKVTAYALGVAYQFTTNLSVAATYNNESFDTELHQIDLDRDDDWFTVGASYRLNNNVELVTDYKVASESDDKLFLRANLNF